MGRYFSPEQPRSEQQLELVVQKENEQESEQSFLNDKIQAYVVPAAEMKKSRVASYLEGVKGPFLTESSARELMAVLESPALVPDKEFMQLAKAEMALKIKAIVATDNIEESLSFINDITAWLKQSGDSDGKDKRRQVQRMIADEIVPGSIVRLPLLLLLTEVDQLRQELYHDDKLVDALETNVSVDEQTLEQLKVLNRLNSPAARVLLHKILDFTQSHKGVLENYTPEEIEKKSWYGSGFIGDIENFVHRESDVSENYLVGQHFKDYLEMSSYGEMKKPGSVHGVAGGGSDAMIFSYRNIQNSYQNRLALGVHEGWPISNQVLPIAPGFYGFYKGDRLQKVFQSEHLDMVGVRVKEKAYIELNNPQDEYIYEQLSSSEDFHPGRKYHPSHELEKLEHLWAFKKHLKAAGREFFYDVERLEHPEKLHPIVLGELFQRNQAYIDSREGKGNAVEAISLNDYEHLLFPQGQISEQQEYIYRYMVSASMRKKVEDDFGIKIEEIPLFGQVQFLNFLDRADRATAERLQSALLKTKDKKDFVVSFLACLQDKHMAESILKIAEGTDSLLSSTLFEKYAEIVGHSQRVKEFLQQEFGRVGDVNEKSVEAIIRQLFAKANGLLEAVAKDLKSQGEFDSEKFINYLNNYRSEVAVLGSALRHTKGLGLSEIKNAQLQIKDAGDLTESEKREMVYAFESNRENLYPGGLKQRTVEEFKGSLNKAGQEFYVFEFKNHPAVFFRVDKRSEDSWYVGSLNLGPEAFESPLAVAVIKAALEQEGGTHNLEADVYEQNPARKFYTRILGFKETGQVSVVRDEEGEEYKYFKLVRPKSEPLELPTAA